MTINWIDSDNLVKETEQSIAVVEQKYNIQFPQSYKEMLKIHSGEFSEELEEMIELSRIVSMNDYPEYYCFSYMDEKQLKKVFPLFESASGNFYGFDYNVLNSDNEPTIVDIDHEIEANSPDEIHRFNSFDEFIEEMEE